MTKKLLDKYGRTQGCEGCFPRTAAPRPHTEACRARLEKAWAEDAQKRVAELEELLGADFCRHVADGSHGSLYFAVGAIIHKQNVLLTHQIDKACRSWI